MRLCMTLLKQGLFLFYGVADAIPTKSNSPVLFYRQPLVYL